MQKFNTLYDMMAAFPGEQSAIDHLREIRWKDGAYCPHCGSKKVYHFSDDKNHKCGKCRKRFSIKVGTIFEDSKIPLRKWFMAVWLITSHKKGIASTQLAKDIGVTQKSAWFMLHRLRHATETKSFNGPLDGDVEVDETYIGGKSKNMHAKARKARKQYDKAPVIGVIKRDGELRAKHIAGASKRELHGAVHTNVSKEARLITDCSMMYRGLTGEYNHHTVNHTAGEYVRDGNVHINTLESVWSLFKRQLNGTHHWVSKKHLQLYINEMTWRFNHRSREEGERVNSLLEHIDGRLRYKELTA